MKKIPFVIILLFLEIFTNIGFAEDNSGDIKKLNVKILQLQQQMLEMQKKHDEEIAALNGCSGGFLS